MAYRELWNLIYKKIPKTYFVVGVTLSIISTIAALWLPQLISQLLNRGILEKILSHKLLLVAMLVFFIGVYILRGLSSYLVGLSGNRAMVKLQHYFFNHILNLPVTTLDSFRSGDLSSRITSDISGLVKIATVVFPQLFLNVLSIIGAIIFLLRINVQLTLISLSLVPLIVFVLWPLNKKLEYYYQKHQEYLGKISGEVNHKLNHIRLVKSMLAEEDEKKGISRLLKDFMRNFNKVLIVIAVESSLVSSLILFIIVVCLLVAGVEVANGSMSFAALTAFILYITQMIEPVSDLSDLFSELAEIRGISYRIMEILQLEKEQVQSDDINLEDGSIVFNKVSFSYDNSKKALDNVSFQIDSGQHIAIVGPSGSGKSTVFSLLMKFYSDYRGSIKIGGRELKELSHYEARRHCSYVSQENTMLQGTILDNLRYGKNRKTAHFRMIRILSDLKLTDMVANLSKGLDTSITETGAGLSEGQKQRLNIARGFMSDSNIYLLDEVTANLDVETESYVVKAIQKLGKHKTILTIAHRLKTIKNADAIMVLDGNGSISDIGKHSDLTKRSALYQRYLQDLD